MNQSLPKTQFHYSSSDYTIYLRNILVSCKTWKSYYTSFLIS